MMQCTKPLYIGKKVQSPVGCGQCLPCRINKRREWTGRILLEAFGYDGLSSFATLTYNDENVPWDAVDPDWPGATQQCLRKKDLQKFMKRLRKSIYPQSVRFFGCGEYGELTQRPHYHVILFGMDPGKAEHYCRKNWQNGFVSVSPLNPQRAAYTASYTVKKWTKKGSPLLRGRPPEFSVCSRRPAIGVAGLERIVAAYHTRSGAVIVGQNRVTRTARLNGKVYPLGRTITRHMLEGIGLPSNYKTYTTSPELHGAEAVKAAKQQATVTEIRHRNQRSNTQL